jgi:hypothetical protein
MAAKLKLTLGNLSPSLSDTIRTDEGDVNLSGATVKLQMRRLGTTTLKVDSAATVVTAPSGEVRYDWVPGDVDTEGEYLAWWKVIFSTGDEQDSQEFIILIDTHSDGEATTHGEISYQTRQLLPLTWDALSKDERYGDRMLRNRVDYIKYKLFSTVVTPAAEASVYNPLLQDYVSKEVALQIIPAGIDYWMNQHTTRSSHGTQEAVSYPDRINALERLQEWLLNEVRTLRPEFTDTFTVRRRGRGPKVSNDDDLITPNPQEFGEPFDEGLPDNLPWSPFS